MGQTSSTSPNSPNLGTVSLLRKNNNDSSAPGSPPIRPRKGSRDDNNTPTTGKDFRERLSNARKASEFAEQYQTIGELGQGATGQVFLVKNKRGEELAMKTINLSRVDPAQLKELQTEVSLLKTLDHPNVVRLVEVYQDSRNVMLVMDHCKGGSLASESSRQRLRTERQVASVIYQLLLAVKYIHDHKIVHRDLKLDNVLFVSEDPNSLHVQLIDFGLSGVQRTSPFWFFGGKSSKKRLFATMCGTIIYLAPEILDGRYDEKCDLWSLGVVTYLLLTGKPPFRGPDDRSTIHRIKTSEPDYSAPIWERLSPYALELVKNLLQKDPTKRWSAERALESPWFEKYRQELDKTGANLEEDVIHSLTRFVSYGKMKKTALLVIAHHFSHLKDLAALKNIFLSLDKDASGSITLGELKRLLLKHNLTDEQALDLFEGVDADDSGEIQLTEFLAATMEAVCKIDKERMADAFDRIAQGEEYITRSHLETLLGKVDREQLKEMISSLDNNKDGKISREEFLQLIHEEQEHEIADLVCEDAHFAAADTV